MRTNHGLNLAVGATNVVNQAGLETVQAPNPDPNVPPLILVPAAPLAVSGTANGEAAAHVASDIPSALVNVTQSVPGPYNATGVGTVEGLNVLLGLPVAGVSLVTATAVRAEAVAVCSAGAVRYAANSEIVDLTIGGTALPLNTPVTQLLAALNTALQPLAAVVDIGLNEVSADGRSVVALRLSVIQAGGPLVQLLVGVASVGEATCAPVPQCSDTADNDADGVIDALDPGCHTDGNPNNPGTYNPNDNDERDVPECSDTGDNDGDGRIDALDPGCHTDGDPNNPGTYNPDDDNEGPQCSDRVDNDGDGRIDFPADPGCTSALDETESPDPAGGAPPATGTSVPTAAAAGLGVAALALFALRRRSAA